MATTFDSDGWTARPADERRVPPSVAQELAAGRRRAVLTFAGQGVDPLPELRDLAADHPAVAEWVHLVGRELGTLVASRRARLSGRYAHGLDLVAWLDPEHAPPASTTTGSHTSMALIFVTQVARLIASLENGLQSGFDTTGIAATTGHSQGMLPACYAAEMVGRDTLDLDRAVEWARYAFWQGLLMERAYQGSAEAGATPMVAISGPLQRRLRVEVDAVNAAVAESDRLVLSLENTPTRSVVSGLPEILALLQSRLDGVARRETEARKAGRFGGTPLSFTWEPLLVSAPFHSQHMNPGLEQMREIVAEVAFAVNADDFAVPVINAATGEALEGDALDAVMRSQFVDPVRWTTTLRALPELGADTVIDLGPGDGVMRLTASNLRGTGTDVFCLSRADGRRALFTRGATPDVTPLNYADFAPRLATLPDGRTVVDNRYTRATGHSPIILPGMTPTTVDVGIVAAAANQGYTAELAGGGQVTERIFRLRMDELREQLELGREVVFNALYLDRYLWDLHLGKQGLVQQARRAGAPISGVTISAGIPPVDEAVALLDELADLGMTLNAFKPGTAKQVEQVCTIAQAARNHTILVHLEGGRAGGHHSWEDLDDLLLATYAKIRREPNLVLCVGGGVGSEARATELLTGRWAAAFDRPLMPVDAVFLGTVTMACAEATTSSSVKQALADAAGTDRWVYDGDADGGVTSGRSQLDADIHYLDNPAARCGRLLDAVAGDADAVAARRDEIVEALNATAKPFFGDLETMTWAEVLERMVDLMAIGHSGRYDDGIWPDVSYRQRVADVVRRAEARLGADAGPEVESVLGDLAELDEPQAVIEALVAAWPEVTTRRLLPQDVRWFVHSVCKRPGKPVCFVPVIDADVRRWYKSDSLWQAHDDRWAAEQVLVIPGPQAVAGIRQADEPVADLLGRFEQHLVAALETDGVETTERVQRRQPAADPSLPTGYASAQQSGVLTLEALRDDAEQRWLDYVAARFSGAIAELAAADVVSSDTRGAEPNPLRTLAVATAGARLAIAHDGEQVSRLTWQTAADADEAVVLEATDDGLEVTIELPVVPDVPQARFVLPLERRHLGDAVVFAIDGRTRDAAYAAAFGAREPADFDLFDARTHAVTADTEQMHAYGAHTGLGDTIAAVPHNACFALVWDGVLDVLLHRQLVGGLLDLVHLDNAVEPLAAWPIAVGDALEVETRVTELRDEIAGRTVRTEATIRRDGIDAARVTSGFFVRTPHGHTETRLRQRRRVARTAAFDAVARQFCADRDWLELDGELAGDVTIEATLDTERPRAGTPRFQATGELRQNGDVVGRIAFDDELEADVHPVLAWLDALAPETDESQDRPSDVLRSTLARAPRDMTGYAEVSGDHNPIHRSLAMARLARLDAPIVHGMWTAARLHAELVAVADGNAERVRELSVRFLAPVALGSELALTVRRTGVRGGQLRVEASAEALVNGQPTVVAQVSAFVDPPRVAYVCPGQGIQQQGMGLDGYQRSRAAREVWDAADAFSRRELGFSILRIVRDNPTELLVDGVLQRHPRGVLNLTQFTQVAMVVLARAQVAELRESGVFVEGAITCGHSVGEYTALSSVLDAVPLEDIVEIVYQRGLAMHTLVPRDENGVSAYAMGVVRPHHAGLDDTAVRAMVARVADEVGFIEIVNFNVRGRQYSVTGEVPALTAFGSELMALQKPGGKPPWILVPGIDVPFHSSVLRDGVATFRNTLETCIPELDPSELEGRYIPNLLPAPFNLSRAWLEALCDLTESPVLKVVLADLDGWKATPRKLTRALLIELLAYQFASPVRWIESQELLFASPEQGGLGVDQIIEIGVGYQPTLANMARSGLRDWPMAGIQVLNVEAERGLVFHEEVSGRQPLSVSLPTPAESGASDGGPASAATENAPAPAEAAQAETAAAPAAPAPTAPLAAPAGALELPATSVADALRTLLALQANVRPDQLSDVESIDELFEGVSSRRNQVLMDIGAEFDIGAIDGAHELPLGDLATTLEGRASRYRAPGPYLSGAIDELVGRAFARAGTTRSQLQGYLESTWGLDEAGATSVLVDLTARLRDGESNRGGALGDIAVGIASQTDAHDALDAAVALRAAALGLSAAKPGAAGGGEGTAVDAAVVDALAERILGQDGVLMGSARDLAERLGHSLERDPAARDDIATDAQRTLDAEFGEAVASRVAPRFQPLRHVAFTSVWAFAQRDIAQLFFDGRAGRLDDAHMAAEARRLSIHAGDARASQTAAWYAGKARDEGAPNALCEALERIARGGPSPVHVPLTRPRVDVTEAGEIVATEGPADTSLARVVDRLFEREDVRLPTADAATRMRSTLHSMGHKAPEFRGRTAVVTGASPGSIALEMVAWLLRGGARVVVTTSNPTASRLAFYRAFYGEHAIAGAELHVVPFNQASRQDVDAFVDWLFAEQSEQAGAGVQVTKRAWMPDLVVPFAAMKDLGTLDALGGESEAAMRALLIGVERLVVGIARRHIELGAIGRPVHAVLPLSPNHGAFGGDGLYAEGKAALEALLAKWASESEHWGRALTLCGARIGWVRGTGLMDANDAVAPGLEARCGIRTFSTSEMGMLLGALCTEGARELAQTAPLDVDLTGGFGNVADLGAEVAAVRDALAASVAERRTLASRRALETDALGHSDVRGIAVPTLPGTPKPLLDPPVEPTWLGHTPSVDLEDIVVIVGLGELGPLGSSRTRFEVEVEDRLSPAGVLELAWTTGLLTWEDDDRGGSWIDVASGEPVPEHEIAARYEDEVRTRIGLRFLDGEHSAFDPDHIPVFQTTYLERDFTFSVSSEAEARDFVAGDPEHTRVRWDGERATWLVTRLAGAEVKVPRRMALSRKVAGALPDGFDPARFGIPRDMVENVDPLSLMNLIATVDAFLAAGMTPEELLASVHPARVGSTQGSGIGGMRSIQRMYTNFLLGESRQSDVLQESLINVIAAYVVQSYVGSYGPMNHPVAACATAAVSLEEGLDKIRLDKADFVVAGAFDDLSREGVIGFGDMNATCDTEAMLERGFEPHQMSRSNDRRRRGFVEAQGGGTVLLARGSVALEMGLPVYGVLAWAGSYGDGVHTSIPAPGQGLVAAAMGGRRSPLAKSLRRWGLSTDDIGVVYKHDTSTAANDPNENAIHDTLQTTLGRTAGNPLWVVSQKTLTGHSKGGAAAWQTAGLCQSLTHGVIPGNRNLECVDPQMRAFGHMAFTDTTLRPGAERPLAAGLVTSLGFGHVSAIVLVLHRDLFTAALPADQRERYLARAAQRLEGQSEALAKVWVGDRAFVERRTNRRFVDGDADAMERAMLLDPNARLGADGTFVSTEDA